VQFILHFEVYVSVVFLLAGQEESKVDIEEGIRFTPFNLREEYEEGEFDADGMYIFKKNKVCATLLYSVSQKHLSPWGFTNIFFQWMTIFKQHFLAEM